MGEAGERTILHCDCNGFYASVECLLRPELWRVPMAVCGDPEQRHGIILAKNQLAKEKGVQTAETIWQARRKCPGLVLVPPHREKYEEYSRIVNHIYQQYTDQVEPFGIDESWLDVTGSRRLFGEGKEIADQLRRRVREETGLTISVGVSWNKIFAKLGSDYKKPDATTVVSRENYRQLVWPLPAGALLFVGGATKKALEELGISTVGALAAADPELLTRRLGKLGRELWRYARGEDDSPVRSAYEEREVKSVGNSITFSRNLVGLEDISAGVAALADSVAARLRKHGLRCRTVQVMIKDPAFRTISRQKPLPHPSHLSSEIGRAALELIRESWSLTAPIRMLAVTGTSLTEGEEGDQLTLFESQGTQERRLRQEKLEAAMDQVRGRYGRAALTPGRLLGEDLGLTRKKGGEGADGKEGEK